MFRKCLPPRSKKVQEDVLVQRTSFPGEAAQSVCKQSNISKKFCILEEFNATFATTRFGALGGKASDASTADFVFTRNAIDWSGCLVGRYESFYIFKCGETNLEYSKDKKESDIS